MLIYIIDDDRTSALVLKGMLEKVVVSEVIICAEPFSKMDSMITQQPDLIFLDIKMTPHSGEEALIKYRQVGIESPIVIISSNIKGCTISRFLANKATEFLLKPYSIFRLKSILYLLSEKYREMNGQDDLLANIITQSDEMFKVFHLVSMMGESNRDILITGETGTGKELIAKALHKISRRKGKMITLNLGGIDDQYFNDTLFGHLKGSNTGACHDRKGMVELAVDGTLFLDEIGDIPQRSQVKLLRLLQEREFQPLGSNETYKANVTIVCATSLPLLELCESGRFRKDLYHRIKSLNINVPPLRERNGDTDLLFKHFTEKACKEIGAPFPILSSCAIREITSYQFPGNVRELENLVYQLICFPKNHIDENDIKRILGYKNKEEHFQEYFEKQPSLPTLKKITNDLIRATLKRTEGNLSRASNILGITRQGLSKRISSL